jgi:hypothetical protein
MKSFFILLASLLLFSFISEDEEGLCVYYYYNMEEDSNIIVVANSYEKAISLFTEHLHKIGLVFEPTNIIQTLPINSELLIYSDISEQN